MIQGSFSEVPAWAKFALDLETGVFYRRTAIPEGWMPDGPGKTLSSVDMEALCSGELIFYSQDPR